MFKCQFSLNKNQIEKSDDTEIFAHFCIKQNRKKYKNKSDVLPQNELILSNRLMKLYFIGSLATTLGI